MNPPLPPPTRQVSGSLEAWLVLVLATLMILAMFASGYFAIFQQRYDVGSWFGIWVVIDAMILRLVAGR